jgi:hypothetical protein
MFEMRKPIKILSEHCVHAFCRRELRDKVQLAELGDIFQDTRRQLESQNVQWGKYVLPVDTSIPLPAASGEAEEQWEAEDERNLIVLMEETRAVLSRYGESWCCVRAVLFQAPFFASSLTPLNSPVRWSHVCRWAWKRCLSQVSRASSIIIQCAYVYSYSCIERKQSSKKRMRHLNECRNAFNLEQGVALGQAH